MGLFDLFRKEKSIQIKKLNFDELKDFISKKRQEINIGEIKVIEFIKNRINLLLIEFENEILAINKINLDNKKEDERFKLIVKGNLNKYTDHLKNLKTNLENLNFSEIQDLFKRIDFIFQDFKKKSFLNFEKATFLIGEELGKVVESIEKFYKDFIEIIESNRPLLDTSKILSDTQKTINRFIEFQKMKDNLHANINDIEKRVNGFDININLFKKDIKDIIESKEYNEMLRKKQEFENKKNKLNMGIANLKEIIDFKELARIYHSNEKQMRIIKEYRENFNSAFEKDNGEAILKFFDKDDKIIQEAIDKVIEKQKEIIRFAPEKDKIFEVKIEIRKIEDKIKELGIEKLKVQKKIFQINDEISDTMNILKQEIIKINLELV